MNKIMNYLWITFENVFIFSYLNCKMNTLLKNLKDNFVFIVKKIYNLFQSVLNIFRYFLTRECKFCVKKT